MDALVYSRHFADALGGPHRVDFEVFYAQKNMPAALGSTGEQKALLVGQRCERRSLPKGSWYPAPPVRRQQVVGPSD